MDLLRDTQFDFLKYRKIWITISFVTMAIGLFGYFFHGKVNIGVDFAGGTQLTLKFRERPDIEALRGLVADAGFKESQIQRFGGEADNEVMIRTPIVEGTEEGSAPQVMAALSSRYNSSLVGRPDLNQIGAMAVAQLLAGADPDGVGGVEGAARYEAVADSILALRRDLGMFTSWDQVAGAGALSPASLAALRERAELGSFAVLAIENVGPQVGAELRKRGILAVVGAMLGMLLYIWIRFELRFAIGATMAVLHDVIVTLGFFYWAGHEFNLTTIAAFLTLIGYSVNDTVVTFDRVRENLRRHRTADMLALMNKSINQTLSRTLITAGTTLLASLTLYLFGGDVIRGFAFVMSIGVVVGTYSSIYIAGPFALAWESWFGPQGRFRKRADGGARPAVAAKGR